MKKFLTNNIGLKILSVFSAFILWIIVVNVDDPVITRVYSGIPVEIVNGTSITSEGKTYEVEDGSDVISVTISAERSIIESLNKENIKATADMKNITFMNTVPIELRTNRFFEKINSISTRNPNLSVVIEEKKSKQIKLSIKTDGEVATGYVAGKITPVVDVVKVSGPESKIGQVVSAEISVDYADMNETFTTSCPIILYNVDGEIVDDENIVISTTEVRTSVEILETKEIPVTAYYVGTAASGFSATGTVICDPSSVVIAGNGENLDSISSIKIPDNVVSIEGATENIVSTVNIKDYLPSGIVLADQSYNGDINIVTVVEAHDLLTVDLPISKIEVINLPDNYTAHVVFGEDTIPVEVAGLQESLLQVSQNAITAQIDANALMPRLSDDQDYDEDVSIYTGSNDGIVLLNLPSGVTQITNVSLEVVINYHEPTEENKEANTTD